jgi:riboflavin transporter FmnP
MIKADFVTGLIFVALGVAALVESLRMPRFETLGINPYSVPGLVPGLLGAVIAGLGAALAVRAARRGGWRVTGFRLAGEANARLATAFVLTFGYAAVLVGELPFWLATGLFVFLFITLFEWRASARKARVLVIAAVEAVLVAAVVTLVFRDLFLVTLP